jgi:hypothetical protein
MCISLIAVGVGVLLVAEEVVDSNAALTKDGMISMMLSAAGWNSYSFGSFPRCGGGRSE